MPYIPGRGLYCPMMEDRGVHITSFPRIGWVFMSWFSRYWSPFWHISLDRGHCQSSGNLSLSQNILVLILFPRNGYHVTLGNGYHLKEIWRHTPIIM